MKHLTLATVFALTASFAQADALQTSMLAYVDGSVRSLIDDPANHEAVKKSNEKHAGLSESEIIALDNNWRSEIGRSDAPTIGAVVNSEVSAALRAHVEASQGRITEIILMDNRGMNVAVSSTTSDFWQGDEAKYQETYPKGPDAVHVSKVELDESSQTYQAQVSYVLSDPGTGSPIGAVTVGLNASAF